MKHSPQIFLSAITVFLASTTALGAVHAKTIPAPTMMAKPGDVLHIPYRVNATEVSKVGYHFGNPDGALVVFFDTGTGWSNALHNEQKYQSASVPVYGFGPSFANGTKQPGENVHSNKGMFVFEVPSNLTTGTYTLDLYYVDGIDRHAEIKWDIKVEGVKARGAAYRLSTKKTVWSFTTINPSQSKSSYLIAPTNWQIGKHFTIPSNNANMWSTQKQQGYYAVSDVMNLNGFTDHQC